MAQSEDSGPSRPGWSRGELSVLATGVLLVADLVLLPWHRYALNLDVGDLGIDLPRFSVERTAIEDPNAVYGMVALVLAGLMVALVAATRLRSDFPPFGQLHLVAGPATAGVLVAKLFANDSFLASGAWLGILLGVGLAASGYLRSQEASSAPAASDLDGRAGPVPEV